MKHLLRVLLLVSFSSALADTPAKIAEDYRKAAAAALVRVNDTLEKATVPLMAALVKAGDTEGADELREQMKAKTEGEPVMKPQSSATALFKSYDAARVKALEPAQKAAISRIDAMLASSEGKKMDAVTELGKVRAEIEAGKIVPAVPPAEIVKSYLRNNKISKKWGYYSSPQFATRLGTIYLNEDGTLSIDAASPGTGTWTPTGDPAVLALDIQNAAKIPEKTEMNIKGDEATLKRVSGMRYLKAE